MSDRLVIRDEESFFGKSFALSWCGPCADGSDLESPSWGLCQTEAQIEESKQKLRDEGRVFEVEDLRAGSGVIETPRTRLD